MRSRLFSQGLCALGALLLTAVGACTYDFDAAFEQTPSAGGSGPTSATGGSGGATTTTGGAGGEGGQAGGENCGNGMDDDMDGDIDCLDSDCSDYACVDPPPMGWTAVAFELAETGKATPCERAWPTTNDLNDGLNAPAASCNCSCGTATIGCSLEVTRAYASNSSCISLEEILVPTSNGGCQSFQSNDFDAARGDNPVVLSGSCQATEQAPTLPPVSWDRVGRLCQDAAVGGGCEASQVCAPQPAAPFRNCIAQDGNQSCPSPFDDKTLVYADHNEGRGCTTCTCGNPMGAQCTAMTEVWYGNDGCSGTADRIVNNDNMCQPGTGPSVNNGSFRYTAMGTSNGCAAQSNPNGSASATMPTTVCCVP